MPTRIKICGITRLEDAELAVGLGASALGFNFYRPSPRYIRPEAALEIIRRAVPPLVMAVGVFAEETDPEHVLSVARDGGVSAIQLHSPRLSAAGHRTAASPTVAAASAQEAAAFAVNRSGRHYPLILALAMDANFKPESLEGLRDCTFLLDAAHPHLKGGTGRTIDWAKAHEAARRARVVLAGGLTPENVAQAIRQVRPFAVDVASGVESAPGVKDTARLRAFFAAVDAADEAPLF